MVGVGVVAGSGVVPSGGDAAAAATAGRIGLVDIQSSFITAGVRDARSYAVNGTALPALALARAWRAKAPADAVDLGPILPIRYVPDKLGNVTNLSRRRVIHPPR